jgi:hypothetical protein
MSSRFVRISSDGRIASGSGTIVVDGQAVGAGFEPQWYGPNLLMVKGLDDQPHTIDLTTKVSLPFAPTGPRYTHLRAGGGRWIGAVDRSPTFKVACARTGQQAWLVEHNRDNNDHSLVLDGVLITRGSVHHPRVEDGYLVWTEGGGTAQRTWGRYPDGSIARLHASGDLWEGAPVPVLTPKGPWVVVMTNRDLRAYPWGERRGKVFATGEDQNFDPDAIWLGGEIVLVWSDHRGTLPPHRGHVRLDDPRVELNPSVVMPPPIVIPPEAPEPDMPDPLLAPNEKATVARVMREHPEIKTGKAHEATRGRILDYICAALNPAGQSRPWGRKSKNREGTNLNTDVIAFLRPDTRFEMYDVIAGDEAGSPMWDGPKLGPTVQGTNGWWAPANPVEIADDPPVEDPPVEDPPPTGDWSAAVAALEARVQVLEQRPGMGVVKLVVTGLTLDVEQGP